MNEVREVGRVLPKVKVLRGIWIIVSFLFYRLFPTRLFWWWRWILLKIFGANVSFNAYVHSSVKIWAPWNLKMEAGSCLGPYSICYNQALVSIEEGATISQYAYLCSAGHMSDKSNVSSSGLITAPITICKDAWVGTRAFINMGVIVGEKAIVGATASVYKDVEPYSIVGGNPAKFIKIRPMNGI